MQGLFPQDPPARGKAGGHVPQPARLHLLPPSPLHVQERLQDRALQEIGPRFTLKLHSLKESLPKGAGVWDGKYTAEYAELEPRSSRRCRVQMPTQRQRRLHMTRRGNSTEAAHRQRPASANSISLVEEEAPARRRRHHRPRLPVAAQVVGLSRRNFYLLGYYPLLFVRIPVLLSFASMSDQLHACECVAGSGCCSFETCCESLVVAQKKVRRVGERWRLDLNFCVLRTELELSQ